MSKIGHKNYYNFFLNEIKTIYTLYYIFNRRLKTIGLLLQIYNGIISSVLYFSSVISHP